jgi:hypothetical protein
MVGKVKRWLGIDRLEHENLRLARSLISAHARIGKLEVSAKGLREAIEEKVDVIEKQLTSVPPKAKIVPTTKRVNWRSFRSAVESASEPEREEA